MARRELAKFPEQEQNEAEEDGVAKTSQGPSWNLLMLIQSLQGFEKTVMSCFICAASFCVYDETEMMKCPGGSRAQSSS